MNVPAAAVPLPMIPLMPPPTYKFPAIPAPPAVCKAPVVVLVLTVVFALKKVPALKVPKLDPVNTLAVSVPLSSHCR